MTDQDEGNNLILGFIKIDVLMNCKFLGAE